MHIGFHGINEGFLAAPESMIELAKLAEDLGMESIWTGERVVVADPSPASSVIPVDARILDTIASLAFLAGQTCRVRLGSGLLLAPHRDPVVVAKELATIDVLGNGRLVVGLGTGGVVRAELDNVGIPSGERGARTQELVDAMRELWTAEGPSFTGRFSAFGNIRFSPSPVQRPHPPIILGGHTAAGFRRALSQGNGWYGFWLTPETAAEHLDALRSAAAEIDRPERLGPLEITVTPAGDIDRDDVDRFRQLGIDRLVFTAFPECLSNQPDRNLQDALARRMERWPPQEGSHSPSSSRDLWLIRPVCGLSSANLRQQPLFCVPVRMYRFDFETDVLDSALGAPHAMDVAYVFGVPDLVQIGGSRPERHQVAEQVSGAFAAFARTGNPGRKNTTSRWRIKLSYRAAGRPATHTQPRRTKVERRIRRACAPYACAGSRRSKG